MHKILLMSILVATIVIPTRASGLSSRTRGLKRTATLMVAFIALWAFSTKYIVPRIIVIPTLEQ